MKKKSISILLFILVINLFAQDNNEIPIIDPTALIEQVNLLSQKTTSITALFVQEKEMSFMEETLTSSGKFYFQKEDLLRWEYTQPFSYAIILNGERIGIVDEGRRSDFDLNSNRMYMEISNVMTGMVNGTLLNSDQFEASWFETGNSYKVKLAPGNAMMQQYLVSVELLLSKTDYNVEEVKMYEKSGDYTRISFNNMKLNETIPAEIFRLD
jgi:outer membrane lipoprotein-sorting protein